MEETKIKIDELLYKNVKIAVLEKRLLEVQLSNQLNLATNKVNEAIKSAGLDPSKNYQLDDNTFSAIEIVE